MQKGFFVLLITIFCISLSFAQDRQIAIEEFNNLQKQGEILEKTILSVKTSDINTAASKGFNVFRLLPREKYDKNIFKIRGGGAFYSFTNQSHNYNNTPQISLDQNYLSVGFAGANYGFIVVLEKTPLDSANQTKEAKFLLTYKPPKLIKEIRAEQRKVRNYEINGLSFNKRVPAIVGNTYLLRAISFNKADILVSFKIHRQDSDRSLIIFWKPIETFETPIILYQTDDELKSKIENALSQKGIKGVIVSVNDNVVVLNGTVPRNKIGEAVMTANEARPKKVVNQLSFQ